MGDFRIVINASGGHGCERKAKAGDRLHARCGRFDCPDCMAYDFTQQLKQRGMLSGQSASSTFIHWPETPTEVVDNMLTNTREKGGF